MKKALLIITSFAAMAVLITACSSNPATRKANTVLYEDTVGFAQFQAWKAMNERIDMNETLINQPAVKNTNTATKTSSMNSSTTNSAKVAKKKGWSKAAKYSAIGGGTGIVLGAVINKRNRVVGGALGGILGGGLGYVIGRSKDKKEGRY